MDLGARQSRGLYLPGTVPFPTPYPSTGPISFEVGHLSYSAVEPPRDKELVVSQEHRGNQTIVRVMLQEQVSAVFMPGVRNVDGVFQPSGNAQVDNFDEGEWFLGSDVNAEVVRKRLKFGAHDDISSRGSKLRGIVFIATERPILRITETSQTAGSEHPATFLRGCTPCKLPMPMGATPPPVPCSWGAVPEMPVPQIPSEREPWTPFTCTRWCISGGFGTGEPTGWIEPIPHCTRCMLPHGGVPGEECRCTCCRCTCCRCTCCRCTCCRCTCCYQSS
jgi:hypothetical protein